MTVKEAAAELGVSVSLIRKLYSQGYLTGYRVGRGRGLIRFDQADIDALKERGRQSAPQPPPSAVSTRTRNLPRAAQRPDVPPWSEL